MYGGVNKWTNTGYWRGCREGELLTSCQFMNWVAPVDILCSLRSQCYPLSFCVCWVRMRVPERGAIQTRKHSGGVEGQFFHTWRLLGIDGAAYTVHATENLCHRTSPWKCISIYDEVSNQAVQMYGLCLLFALKWGFRQISSVLMFHLTRFPQGILGNFCSILYRPESPTTTSAGSLKMASYA
jgi:hypothetical protein